MSVKTLPERKGIVEGPFMYARWWKNYCKGCDLEIGAYYNYNGQHPPKRDLCLKCADKLIDQAVAAC